MGKWVISSSLTNFKKLWGLSFFLVQFWLDGECLVDAAIHHNPSSGHNASICYGWPPGLRQSEWYSQHQSVIHHNSGEERRVLPCLKKSDKTKHFWLLWYEQNWERTSSKAAFPKFVIHHSTQEERRLSLAQNAQNISKRSLQTH